MKSHIHIIHEGNKKKAQIIQSNKEPDLDLDEIPILESGYLDKGIKEEILPQSIEDFWDVGEDEIKREEFTFDDMPNFEMDSAYLDKTIKKEIKLEPIV